MTTPLLSRPHKHAHHPNQFRFACAILAAFLAVLTGSPAALAADPRDTSTAADGRTALEAQNDAADDGALRPAEPDYRVVNLPTTLPLPVGKGAFGLTHRFGGNLRRGSFSEQASHLFGIDEGAAVGFEYRIGVAPRFEAVAYRTVINRTVQLTAKYDGVRQRGSMPVSASFILAVEGTNNLQERHAPSLGVSVSRTVGEHAALYAVPLWVHNSAAATGVSRDTAVIGLGARVRVRDTVYASFDVSPRVSGFKPGKPLYGFSLDKRAGGHVFQMTFTNGLGTTFGQIARGGQPGSLSLGFNLTRKFF